MGVYIADARGTARRRITNSCSIYGTDGPDVLHGDFSRVLYGLGGAPLPTTRTTSSTGTPSTAARQHRLFGGFGQDDLPAGPATTRSTATRRQTSSSAGPPDVVRGDGGDDTVFAVDGQRGRITCGKNAYDRRDRVYADRIDVVAADCEIVHRR